MKVVICGSRTLRGPIAKEIVLEALDEFFDEDERKDLTEIVTGECSAIEDGKFVETPDQFGEIWAESHGIPLKRFPADWKKQGKAAGPIRNAQMADYADFCVAFWDGVSSGTKHMFDQMTKRAKPSFVSIFPVTMIPEEK
jgi:hypothetical protein